VCHLTLQLTAKVSTLQGTVLFLRLAGTQVPPLASCDPPVREICRMMFPGQMNTHAESAMKGARASHLVRSLRVPKREANPASSRNKGQVNPSIGTGAKSWSSPTGHSPGRWPTQVRHDVKATRHNSDTKYHADTSFSIKRAEGDTAKVLKAPPRFNAI